LVIGSQSLASLHGQSPLVVSQPATPSGRPCGDRAELKEAVVASAATAEIAMAWERITGGLKASRMPQWRTAQQQQRSRSQELPLCHEPRAASSLARGPRGA
jgi:hypothetical protein